MTGAPPNLSAALPGHSDIQLLSERGAVATLRAVREGRPVAVRRVSAGATPDELGEFLRELAVLSVAQASGLPELVDHGEHADGTRFLTRGFVAGDPLDVWAQGRAADEVGAALVQVTDVLEVLHALGFRHGDLKPSNLIVDADARVHLVDFGLSVPHEQAADAVAGTELYLAPELLVGSDATSKSDLFSLGAIAHRLLGGTRASAREFYARFPRAGFFESHGAEIGELPEWARDWVASLVAVLPEDRPPSAGHAAQLLRQRLGLGFDPPSSRPRIEPPILLGRRKFVDSLVSELGSANARSLVVQLPSGESSKAVLEALRVEFVLAGLAATRVDMDAVRAEVTDAGGLDRWASSLAVELNEHAPRDRERNATIALARVEACDPWSEHAIRTLARACSQIRAQRNGLEPPRIVVLTTERRPALEAEFEQRVHVLPPLDEAALSQFLEPIFDVEEGDRIRRLAGRLARASEGAIKRCSALLECLQREGHFSWDGLEPRLRPGPLPDLSGLLDAAHEIDAAEPACQVVLAAACESGRVDVERCAELLDESAATTLRLAGAWIDRGVLGVDKATLFVNGKLSLNESATTRLRELHLRRAELGSTPRLDAAISEVCATAGVEHDAFATLVDRAIARAEPERALAMIEQLARPAELLGMEAPPEFRLRQAYAWCLLGHRSSATDRMRESDAANASFHVRAWRELVLGQLELLQHREDDALEHFETAAAIDASFAPQAQLAAARLLFESARYKDLLERLGSLVDATSTPQSMVAFDLAVLVAMAHFRSGETQLARERLTSLVDCSDSLGDRGVRAIALIDLALVDRRTDRLVESVELLEEAVKLAQSSGRIAVEALALATLGGVLRDLGDVRSADEALSRAQGMRERLGDRAGAANLLGIRAMCQLERGHASAAKVDLERAIEGLEGPLRRRSAPVLTAKLDALLARFGAPAVGESDDDAAIVDPRIFIDRGRAVACRGEREDALTLVNRGLALASKLGLTLARDEAEWVRSILLGEPFKESNSDPSGWTAIEADTALAVACNHADRLDDLLQLADWFEQRGRDDRLARTCIAIAARSVDEVQVAAASSRGQLALDRCTRGLGESESECFKQHLLGLPDPWPSDLERFDSIGITSVPVEPAFDWNRLLEINRRLVESEGQDDLLEEIVGAARSLTGAERAYLVLERNHELELESLRVSTASGPEATTDAESEFQLSTSILREALESTRPLRLSNASDDPVMGDAPSVSRLELRSILAVGLHVDAELRAVILVDHRLRSGAFDSTAELALGALADQAVLALRQVRRLEQIRQMAGALERRVHRREQELKRARAKLAAVGADVGGTGLIGRSQAIDDVRRLLERLAPAELPVLVRGESGTGKELAARALHAMSGRSERPFVAQNCAALPEALFESELFGHKRGSFTGAHRDHAGLFERVGGGTLFLDEIGEMPLALQAKLLRVLETSEVQRLGDDHIRPVHFRLVTATNRDLTAEIEASRFREDLYYRLAAVEVCMPSLDDRPEDIPLLVEHFSKLDSHSSAPEFSREVLSKLMHRAWPGNVRELRNEIQRLMVLGGARIDDPTLVHTGTAPRSSPARSGSSQPRTLAEVERDAILGALETAEGDKGKAAKLLGISRAKVYQRLKEWRQSDGAS